MAKEFPSFVKKLPEIALPQRGLRGWLLQTDKGQFLFCEAVTEVIAPERATCDQSTVVVTGKVEVSTNGEAKTYQAGDTFYISEGTTHQTHMYPGYKAIHYFSNRNHIKSQPKA